MPRVDPKGFGESGDYIVVSISQHPPAMQCLLYKSHLYRCRFHTTTSTGYAMSSVQISPLSLLIEHIPESPCRIFLTR